MGDSTAFEDSEVDLDIQGVRSFTLETEDHEDSNDIRLLSARIEWQPDIEFLPSLDGLLPAPPRRGVREFYLLEQLVTLQIIQAYNTIKHITPSASHLVKYENWLAQRMQEFKRGENHFVPESQTWITLDFEQQRIIHNSLSRRLEETDVDQMDEQITRYKALKMCNQQDLESVEGAFQGAVSPVEAVMTNDSLATIQGLETDEGAMMFSEYMFTDISRGFFSAARERFKNIPEMAFRTLDITRDLVKHGFVAASFDLIVCANVRLTTCIPMLNSPRI